MKVRTTNNWIEGRESNGNMNREMGKRIQKEQKLMKQWIHPSINSLATCDLSTINQTYQGILKWIDTVKAVKMYSKRLFKTFMATQRKVTDFFTY